MFVPVLATSTCTRIPFDPEVLVIERYFFDITRVDYGYGDGGCMNSAFSFRWWNSLDSVATSFIIELCQIIAFDFDSHFTQARARQAGSSAELCTQLAVCESQIFGKELGVVATFSSTNFNEPFHCVLLKNVHSTDLSNLINSSFEQSSYRINL